MKKTNKGFSMVELIIVIAIMAILAGALAPALIKYINKSRISTDIQTGQTIATAITTALSNEAAFDAAPAWSMHPLAAADLSGDDFKTEFASALGVSAVPTGKAKKDMQGNTMDQSFYIDLDAPNNTVKVYVGAANATNEVYPDTGSNLK